ncbi:MAG: hypothetical protein Q9190_001152 [Brigantiaea leucoxantha]
MQVGNPPQSIRVLPSTSGSCLWAVLPLGCNSEDPKRCASLRGDVFDTNKSSTWSEIGLYSLSIWEERPLGYDGNGSYGNDTLKLGWPGDGLPSIDHQVIAGFATKDFYLGVMGLTPYSVNFSTLYDSRPSILSGLKAQGSIPSLSWAYTAGAYYQQPPLFGSLTLGGYDRNRFVPNNISIPFSADISRGLLVGVQSISTDTTGSPLLKDGIYAFIDSLVPSIWLPIEVCDAFERAFNLFWNATMEMYFVNDTIHEHLLNQKANVSFRIGRTSYGGDTIDIIMPYESFDLTIGSPLFESPQRYFPLKRAQNYTQYTLGRVFLQQAYIIADYERSQFSVSQALTSLISSKQDIVTILSPTTNSTDQNPQERQTHSLSRGQLAGILTGSLLFTACILGALTFLGIRRRQRGTKVSEESTATDLPSKSSNLPELQEAKDLESELENTIRPTPELHATHLIEMHTPGTVHSTSAELTSSNDVADRPEMPTDAE